MEHYRDIYSLSDREIAEDIGEKIRKIRLKNNIARSELQRITGVHMKTVGDAEGGKNITMTTLISVLRGLNALHLIQDLVEDEPLSPVSMAKNRGTVRERATGGR